MLIGAIILFSINYKVQDLENIVAEIKKELIENTNEIQVLEAEWAHLNNPARLREFGIKELGLAPLTPQQLIFPGRLPHSVKDQNPNIIQSGLDK
ncbi:MAG: hypothetical protein CMM25_08275 [Rhodospirillaceae bacterium]|nr:hypothetical protein [Rhodospirillaceae bacterium]|tara:strand:+ start:164 stop:448 length:285 start_codon:yes stop_codon:yes gene_type:complete